MAGQIKISKKLYSVTKDYNGIIRVIIGYDTMKIVYLTPTIDNDGVFVIKSMPMLPVNVDKINKSKVIGHLDSYRKSGNKYYITWTQSGH